MKSVLLSGGVDSAVLAFIHKPDVAVFIDYSQRAAAAEADAAENISIQLGIPFRSLKIDCSAIAMGDMARDGLISRHTDATEWWPYRNQILITFAAALLIEESPIELLLGTVKGDEKHADGRRCFFNAMNGLLELQEGDMSVTAPLLEKSTEEWIKDYRVPKSLLGWTYSCHLGNVPCGRCNGCYKRQTVLGAIGILV